jgi:hypothetical protein
VALLRPRTTTPPRSPPSPLLLLPLSPYTNPLLPPSSSLSAKLVGSLFLPTKQLLAQQRFRPWNGVWLSEAYLASPEGAADITREIVRIYREFGVEVLVEAPGVRTLKVEGLGYRASVETCAAPCGPPRFRV